MGSLRMLAFALLLPLVCATNIKYCENSGDYVVKVSDVKISPNPVVPGKTTTFDFSASTGQNLSNGKVVIRVTYFGVQVHTETHDLCEEISCPIAAGKFVLSHTQSLPVFTPPGLYTLRITMEDDLNRQFGAKFCPVFIFSGAPKDSKETRSSFLILVDRCWERERLPTRPFISPLSSSRRRVIPVGAQLIEVVRRSRLILLWLLCELQK
ncbi:hypothetical protein NL676_004625 [Syzygium grande]|nr:hypothetical protein NL676_004625 [Syzygium grande]